MFYKLFLLLFTLVKMARLEAIEETCFYQFNTCISRDKTCSSRFDLVQKHCGVWNQAQSLTGCYRESQEPCKEALSSMLKNQSNFMSCTCSSFDLSMDEIGECNQIVKYLHDHPCMRDPPIFHDIKQKLKRKVPEPYSINLSSMKAVPKALPEVVPNEMDKFDPIEVDFSLRSLLKTFQLPNRVISTTNCSQIISYCQSDEKCSKLRDNFPKLCSSDSLLKNEDKCRSLWREVAKFGLSQSCTCNVFDNPRVYSICIAHQKHFIDNKALAVLENKDKFSYMSTALPMKLNDLNKLNCLKNAQKCTSSERCLDYLMSQEKCDNSLRDFVSQPEADSYLPICSCDGLSGVLRQDCIKQKAILQPDCSRRGSSERHCVASIRDCINNPDCRNVYVEYATYCLKNTKGECHPENLDRCYEAKRILLASNVLSKECSCSVFYSLGVPGENSLEPLKLTNQMKDVCQRFQKAMKRSECFSQNERKQLRTFRYTDNALLQGQFGYQADQSFTSDETKACSLTKAYGFKEHSLIRIYNETDYEGNSEQNYCSKLCKCNSGCQGIPCLERIHYQPKTPICNGHTLLAFNNIQFTCDQEKLYSFRPYSHGLSLFVSFNLYELDLLTNLSLNLRRHKNQYEMHRESSLKFLENELNSAMHLHQKEEIKCRFKLRSMQQITGNLKNQFLAKFDLDTTTKDLKYCSKLAEYTSEMLRDNTSYQKRYSPMLSLINSVEIEQPQASAIPKAYSDRLTSTGPTVHLNGQLVLISLLSLVLR